MKNFKNEKQKKKYYQKVSRKKVLKDKDFKKLIKKDDRNNVGEELEITDETLEKVSSLSFLPIRKYYNYQKKKSFLKSYMKEKEKSKGNILSKKRKRNRSREEFKKENPFKRIVKKRQVQNARKVFTKSISIKTKIINTFFKLKAIFIASTKTFIIIIPIIFLVLLIMALIIGAGSVAISTYNISGENITKIEQYFKEKEIELYLKIKNTPFTKRGYRKYSFSLDEISHNPNHLISYLNSLEMELTFKKAKKEMDKLFNKKYKLTYKEIIRKDENNNTYKELKVILKNKKISKIVEEILKDDNLSSYSILNATRGNIAVYNEPVLNWHKKITSMYGSRIDPFTFEKSFHGGIDIADRLGTSIFSLENGFVINAGTHGGYGNFIDILLDDKTKVRYAHLNTILVRKNQIVKRGEKIATMGSTGRSTGSHLHLEIITKDNIKLNPYFFIRKNEQTDLDFINFKANNSSVDSKNISSSEVQKAFWNYFISKGYSEQSVAGMMGNVHIESGGFNLSAVESNGEGIGLIQWSYGRKKAFLNYAIANNTAWNTLGIQLSFLNYELNSYEGTRFKGGINGFKNLKSVANATHEFCFKFERPNVRLAHYERRLSWAYFYYNYFKKGG